jgi:hypothetical protein
MGGYYGLVIGAYNKAMDTNKLISPMTSAAMVQIHHIDILAT